MQRMSIYQFRRTGAALLLASLLLPPQTSVANSQVAQVELAARTCKQVSSCEEAVILWCNGYRRADADSDGIPCENVCSTREQVDEIRRVIGC
jgi:hypothetical protein